VEQLLLVGKVRMLDEELAELKDTITYDMKKTVHRKSLF